MHRCRVSEAEIYLYISSEIAKAGPEYDVQPEHPPVQKILVVFVKVAFIQKGLMGLSFLQTGKPHYFPELKFSLKMAQIMSEKDFKLL